MGVRVSTGDHQRADRAAVVRTRDRTVALLPSGVPNLRLDRLALDAHRARGELHADGRLALLSKERLKRVSSKPERGLVWVPLLPTPP